MQLTRPLRRPYLRCWFERMELVTHMVDEAARIVPGRLNFHWSHPLHRVLLSSCMASPWAAACIGQKLYG